MLGDRRARKLFLRRRWREEEEGEEGEEEEGIHFRELY